MSEETKGVAELDEERRARDLDEERRALLELLLAEEAEEAKAAEAAEAAGAPSVDAPDAVVLSPAQLRLWVADRVDPGNGVYNIPASMRLSGPLSPARLAAAIQSVVDRHDSLRTTFGERDSHPAQLVAPRRVHRLPLVDLSTLPRTRAEETALTLAAVVRAEPFDLSRGPLLRTVLAKIAADDWALLATIHHIVADGWSVQILMREIGGSYAGAPLPPLPIQYPDYAEWLAKKLAGGAFERQIQNWREHLDGAPTVLDFPSDHPRPPVRRFDAGTVERLLPEALALGWLDLARRAQATSFMAGLALYGAWLGRISNVSDLLIGTPVAGRTRVETEGLIGFFVNNLVLRVNLSGSPSALDLLARSRDEALFAFENQDVPFDRIAEEVGAPRSTATTPLYQAQLQVAGLGVAAIPASPAASSSVDIAAGLSARPLFDGDALAMFDLSLAINPASGVGGMGGVGFRRLTLGYNLSLFERATVERLLAAAERLLAGMVADPEVPLERLPLLGPEERAQIVVAWNATRVVRAEPPPSLDELLRAQAAATPEAIAVTFEGESISYAELDRRVVRLARRLRERGVGPETFVGVAAERSFELVVALLAVLRAGGAYVPIDPSYPEDRLRFMIEDAGLPVLITSPDLAARFTELAPAVPQLLLDPKTESDADARAFEPFEPAPLLPENAAYAIFTSGSTGRPKAAINAHRAIVNRILWKQEEYGLTPRDVVLQKTPFSFDVSVWEFFWPLILGARLVVAKPDGHKDPAYLVDLIVSEGVTTLHFVPSMLQVFLEHPDVSRCRSLVRVMASGEALSLEAVHRFHERIEAPTGARLHNLYGPTEAAVDVTFWECAPERLDANSRSIPIGKPIANLQTFILDREMNPVPIGVAGELYLGGEGLGRGYLDRPSLTADRFIPSPFADERGRFGARLYKTGDLARHRADGDIEYLGRLDFQVKIRGFRIELGEIETALQSHETVAEAAVLAIASAGAGGALDTLVAYVSPKPHVEVSALSAESLKEHLRRGLPEHMVPSRFVFVAQMPLSPNGKLDRKALAQIPIPVKSGASGSDGASVEFGSPLEELVASFYGDILGRERVGPRDNFFDLGGHSLLATRLVSRIREEFGVELAVREVFETLSPARLAERIEAARRKQRGEQGLAVIQAIPAVPPAERPTTGLPLSFSQERLWFLDQLDPQSAAYNMPSAVRLEGAIHPSALARAFEALVLRHETLRTTFPNEGGRAIQAISPRPLGRMSTIDLGAITNRTAQEAELARHAQRNAVTPFDLARGPLARLTLVILDQSASSERAALLVGLHHIVSDGWSMGIFVAELSELARRFARGEKDPLASLPPLPIQYADYALWQRGPEAAAILDAQLVFWRRALGDVPQRIELPTDRLRPAVQETRGSSVAARTEPEVATQLAGFARAQGSTPFMVFLAAWGVLLSRWSGQRDFAVGTPIANRTRREIEGLIGFFVNTLALRLRPRPERSFRELLAEVRESTLDAYAHQDLPFERLVDEIQPERNLSWSPLFQTLFVLQNNPQGSIASPADGGEVASPGVQVSDLVTTVEVSKFDLTLNAAEFGRDVFLRLVFSTALYDRATPERMLAGFQRVLAAALDNPDAAIGGFAAMSDAEQKQLIVTWNMPRVDYPAEGSIVDLLRDSFATRADEIALVYEGQEPVTYRDLEQRVYALANHLLAQGVGPESVVGVCLERSYDLIVAVLAVLHSGAAYLPLDPALPAERLQFMVADAGVERIVGWRRFADVLGSSEISWIDLQDETTAQEVANATSAPPRVFLHPESAAYLIYTSGSTGIPKGVVGTHGALANRFRYTRVAEQTPNDRLIQKTTISFDVSLLEILGPLVGGGRIVIAEPGGQTDADYLVRLIAEHEITFASFPPTTLAVLIETGALDRCQALRTLITGGETVPPDLPRKVFEHLPRANVYNRYGPTETTLSMTSWPCRPDVEERSLPIGHPTAKARVYLLDDRGELVPRGAIGEIAIGGPCLARGYHRRPDATAEKFIPDPFSSEIGARLYLSGDLARLRADGAIEFVGRIDGQVKIRGFRIELGEIDATLRKVPGVRDVAVVDREDGPNGNKRLVAYLVVDPAQTGENLSAELRSFLGERLPAYMVPSAFVTIDRLPLTPTGKVDRRALPPPPPSVVSDDAPFAAPRGAVESALAQVWSRVLRRERVGVHDNFFDLGGDSILSIQIVARVREAGVKITPKQLFQHQTIAELARVATLTSEATAIAQGPETGPVPLTPIQRWFLEPDDEQRVDRHWWNQAFLLEPSAEIQTEAVRWAFLAVIARHAALRARFVRGEAGWAQEIVEIVEIDPVDESIWLEFDLSHLSDEEARSAMASEIVGLQGSFDLSVGPVVRGALFFLGRSERRLWFGAHHLVVDAVSWRVLFEDLERAAAAASAILAEGESALESPQISDVLKKIESRLPAKTTPWRTWSERLSQKAQSAALGRERSIWQARPSLPEISAPITNEAIPNRVGAARSISTTLSAEIVERLNQKLPSLYKTQLQDALLAGVAKAIATASPAGFGALRVELEGHGREEIADDIDVSRTVGWFTTLHPVVFEVPAQAGVEDVLLEVKERLREIPEHGLGYGLLRFLRGGDEGAASTPKPWLAFNYFGQVGEGSSNGEGERSADSGAARNEPSKTLFRAARESAGPQVSPNALRNAELLVTAALAGSELRIEWVYAEGRLERETVERWSNELRAVLTELATSADDVEMPTPADFPLAAATLRPLWRRDRAAFARWMEGVEDVYPLSPLQEGMLFHAAQEGVGGAYFEQLATEITGPFDDAAFARAWHHLLVAHPILRTSFEWRGLARPVQKVHRLNTPEALSGATAAAVGLSEMVIEDWLHTAAQESKTEQSERVRRYLAAERARGFALDRPPLARAALLRLGDERRLLVLSYHHVLLDGWSFPLVVGDLFAAYTALARGEQPTLPHRRSFRDYVEWLAEQDLVKAEAFFRAELQGIEAPTSLAIVHPQRGVSEAAGEIEALLDHTAYESLQALARARQFTFNTFVQGAWGILLARTAGVVDAVYGTTLSGRPAELAGVEGMVGLFINTLPVRVRVERSTELVPWLAELQERSIELRQFEHTPLVEIRRWSEIPGTLPLFESIVVFENVPRGESLSAVAPEGPAARDSATANSGGLGGSAPRLENTRFVERTHFPLTAVAAPGRGLALRLSYDPAVVEASDAEHFFAAWRNLLAVFSESHDVRLGELSLLSVAERSAVVRVGAGRSAARPLELVHESIVAQAERTPNAIAVVAGGESLTYRDLIERATALATYLRHLGLGIEDRVGIAVERNLSLPIATLGVLLAGGTYVPLDPAYPEDRLAFMAADAGLAALLVNPAEAARFDALRSSDSAVVVIEADGRVHGEVATRAGNGDPLPRVSADHLAYTIYTSGSTGRPKGVELPHGALANFLASMIEAPGICADDVFVSVTSLSFDIAGLELYAPLMVGARVVVARREEVLEGARLAELLEVSGATVLQATPSHWRWLLLSAGWAGRRKMKAFCGGEAMPPGLAADLLPKVGELWNLYGPTETAVWSTAERLDGGAITIGRPIAETQVYIVDSEGSLVPAGVPGELWIGGDGVARGYRSRPDLTAERFVPDGFGAQPGRRLYRTGDLATWASDGETVRLKCLGRIDHQVKIRGHRIELGEIEAALAAHPAVSEAVVVVAMGGGGDLELVAYYVAHPSAERGRDLNAELRDALRASLPAAMIPTRFIPLDAMPQTPNGKIDRRRLPDPFERGMHATTAPASTSDAPDGEAPAFAQGALERELAAIWREVLLLPEDKEIHRSETFFDLGGHSLSILRVQGAIQEQFGASIPIVDLFRHPTLSRLAAFLEGVLEPPTEPSTTVEVTRQEVAAAVEGRDGGRVHEPIAIIGAAGRFPMAPDLETYWRNLRDGVEAIRFFERDELLAAGLAPSLIDDPNFVAAGGLLEEADGFDAAFFQISPREAEMLDPQHRALLEASWAALEDAGYDPETYAGRIGLWAGLSVGAYAMNVLSNRELLSTVGLHTLMLGLKPEFAASRVSYKLNLRGPSLSLQTACSTSLVTVAQAVESLLADQCEMALAGGVSITTPRAGGYLYQEGNIFSKDGHCRAFDAAATGTVGGNGVGLVVLKRLSSALRDGDAIRGLILGCAINNDGHDKVGYMAPSVEGQAAAIRQAFENAGVEPRTVGFVETHGTATPIGDPIEIAALSEAFGPRSPNAGGAETLLGSVKSNLGHLDTAAGIAGLLKAVLALEHGEVPPTLHFERPNPKIPFERTPFRVAAKLEPWPLREGADASPRRAGVSSFGIGGTNAHIVLEQAPTRPPIEPPSAIDDPTRAGFHVLTLSARSEAALEQMSDRFVAHLEHHADLDLADAAFTLQSGRRAFPYRRAIVARTVADAVSNPRVISASCPKSLRSSESSRPVAFLFPGQGAQRPGMAQALESSEPVFRAALAACFETLRPTMGMDLREILFPADPTSPEAAARLERTEYAQPALFAIEWALAELWRARGVVPQAMLGHSIGEWTAAAVAGVFSLDDALRLVALRGRLMGSLPRGAMLAVPLSEAEIQSEIQSDSLDVAAVNAPKRVVVSGETAAIERLEQRLAERGVPARRLHTSHAFHSAMMDPILDEFRRAVAAVERRAPKIPYVSNLTGTWVTAEQATDPHAWAEHLRRAVRFADGLKTLAADSGAPASRTPLASSAWLEVGPGTTLAALARQVSLGAQNEARPIVSTLPLGKQPEVGADDGDASAAIAEATARLWTTGVAIDWAGARGGAQRRRVSLPTYPFERKRFWLDLPSLETDRTAAGLSPNRGVETVAPSAAQSSERVNDHAALEAAIADVWCQLLGHEQIDRDADFFELGGDSLLALQVATQVKKATGHSLSAPQLLSAPTVAQLASLLAGESGVGSPTAPAPVRSPVQSAVQSAVPSLVATAIATSAGSEVSASEIDLRKSLVPIQVGAAGARPLFAIHPVGGTVFFYRALARALGAEQPVWGLQSLGLVAGEVPIDEMTSLAARYVRAIRGLQPRGPYALVGSSMGGAVAYEMAQQLGALGETVELLGLIDTLSPSHTAALDDVRTTRALVHMLVGDRFPVDAASLVGLEPEAQLDFLWQQATTLQALPEGFTREQASALRGIIGANWRAHAEYRPTDYAGELVFFRARERRTGEPANPEIPWLDLARGGAAVHVVEGNHESMLQLPHVEEIAAVIRRRLARS